MQGKKPKKTRKKHVFFLKKTRNEKNGFFHNPRDDRGVHMPVGDISKVEG